MNELHWCPCVGCGVEAHHEFYGRFYCEAHVPKKREWREAKDKDGVNERRR